jgi:hypothetical protein
MMEVEIKELLGRQINTFEIVPQVRVLNERVLLLAFFIFNQELVQRLIYLAIGIFLVFSIP